MILVHLTQEILKNKNKNQKTQHDESQQLAGKMTPADTESTQARALAGRKEVSWGKSYSGYWGMKRHWRMKRHAYSRGAVGAREKARVTDSKLEPRVQ